MMTRNGKIARLPRALRDQLNRRLDDGEQGDSILPWLNAQPEAQALPVREQEGRKITKQNLSEWRKGGLREWQAQQEMLAHARDLAADAGELSEAADGLLTDHLASVLSARYARLLSGWDGEVNEEFRRQLKALRTLSQDIVELRKGDHSAARLKLEQERLDEAKDWSESELLEHFHRWAQNPTVREAVCTSCLTHEEKAARIREIFGLNPKASDPAVQASPSESNPVQPVFAQPTPASEDGQR